MVHAARHSRQQLGVNEVHPVLCYSWLAWFEQSCVLCMLIICCLSQSVMFTPCHIHMVCSISQRTYGQQHPSLVSTSVYYLWLKHEIWIFLDICWSIRYSSHPKQHPPLPHAFYVDCTATIKVSVHWISTENTTECCNGWWCELQQQDMDLYRQCTVKSLIISTRQ
jgi:hypothetical protein